MRHSLLSVITVGAGLLGAAPAAAQLSAPQAAAVTIPALTFSVGTGVGDDLSPTIELGAEYRLGRRFAVSADVLRWSSSYGYQGFISSFEEQSRGWAAGATGLVRMSRSRVAWYGGMGLSFFHVENSWQQTYNNNTYADAYTQNGVGLHWTTGVDVRLTNKLMAYGGLQMLFANDAIARWTVGVRVVGRSMDVTRLDSGRIDRLSRSTTPRMPVERAIGRTVHVFLTSGARQRGELVSLSATDVVIRERSGDVRYALANVRLVETIHRKALKSALIGAAIGVALSVPFIASGCDEECIFFVPMLAGIGAGGSAAVGAVADVLTAPRHVVWASKPSTTVRVAPILGPKTAGVRVGWSW